MGRVRVPFPTREDLLAVRWGRFGPRPAVSAAERFWAKVDRWDPDECWEWTGVVDRWGYGALHFDEAGKRRTLKAYRVAYALLVGPITLDRELDHLCRNPGCVNPKHLEPVTHRENLLRGMGPSALHARQTHCKRGHEFTAENTYTCSRGTRVCQVCRRERNNRRYRLYGKRRTPRIVSEVAS